MYIAGLNIHHAQGLEALVAVSTCTGFYLVMNAQRRTLREATVEAGPIVTKTPLVAKLATITHALAVFVPPVAYVSGVCFNGFDQPPWIQRFSLPNEWEFKLGMAGYSALRTISALFIATCLPASVVICTRRLGAQFSPIGVREKASVVSSGPYAYVRHPMYTAFIVSQPFFAAAFWSWAPLYSLPIMAAAFMLKIPYEEGLIMEQSDIATAYSAYKIKVPYRLIPYIW